MAQYANQKSFIIHRENPLNSGKQYLALDTQHLAQASKLLTPVGFKLYLYLCSNKDGYSRDYSPRDFSNIYGVSYDSARKAPQNLIEAGYLVLAGGEYHFYEEPQETISLAFKPERRLVPLTTEGYIPMSLQEFLNQVVNIDKTGTVEEATDYWKKCEVANNE